MSESKKEQKAGVILPAAGFGTRMEAGKPKQFLCLAGTPILIHTVTAFLDCPGIHCLVLAIADSWRDQVNDLLRRYLSPEKRSTIILARGGATRQQSVRSGLEALPEDITLVLVHDAARPLLSGDLIEDCLEGAREHGAVIAAIPVHDTLKRVNSEDTIIQTIERRGIYRAQTPQAMRRELLEQAYLLADKDHFTGTDEASLLEHAGISVAIVCGEERNMKVTRPGDLIIARNILGGAAMQRVGHGFDVHRLVKDRPLILGGEEIDYPLGLLGHSDADVLTHALIDALLGAAAAGDIGKHFPDSDPRYKGIDSQKLLARTMTLITERGYRLSNADLTIICQKPKLAPYLEKMRTRLAGACLVAPEAVNIKATTTEQLGFSGRGEGIAAHAVVLIQTIS